MFRTLPYQGIAEQLAHFFFFIFPLVSYHRRAFCLGTASRLAIDGVFSGQLVYLLICVARFNRKQIFNISLDQNTKRRLGRSDSMPRANFDSNENKAKFRNVILVTSHRPKQTSSRRAILLGRSNKCDEFQKISVRRTTLRVINLRASTAGMIDANRAN